MIIAKGIIPVAVRKFTSLIEALSYWRERGYPIASQEEIDKRLGICKGCEKWDQARFFGIGKCNTCGCSAVKQWLATSKCPLNKWGES